MRSTQTHTALALSFVLLLAIVSALLVPAQAWRYLFSRRVATPALMPDPPAVDLATASALPATPTPGRTRVLLRLVECSFIIAADEPPATPPPASPPMVMVPGLSSQAAITDAFKPDLPVELVLVRVQPFATLLASPLLSDWNHDNTVSTDDLWAFMNSWFAGAADVNHDGQTRPDDLLLFVQHWFDGK